MRKITTASAAIALAATMAALAPTGAMAETTTCTRTEVKGDWFMDYSIGARRFAGHCRYTCENGHTVLRSQLPLPTNLPEGVRARFADRGSCFDKTIVIGPGEYDR